MNMLIAALFAATTSFPYGQEVETVYCSSNATITVDGGKVSVPKTADNLETNTLVVATVGTATFEPIAAADWDAAVSSAGAADGKVVLTMKDVEGVATWYAKIGTTWQALAGTGDAVAAAGTWNVKIDFDYTQGANGVVRFNVRGEGKDDYSALKDGGDPASEWIALPAASAIAGMDIGGYGSVDSAVAKAATREAAAVVEGGKISVYGTTELKDLAAGEYTIETGGNKANPYWEDNGSTYAKLNGNTLIVESGSPVNGLKSYDSYVLGLDADNADSKPVVATVQNTADKVAFKIENVTPNTDAATVTYVLKSDTSPEGTYETEEDSTKEAEAGELSAALPSSGVKYYKLAIKVEPKK